MSKSKQTSLRLAERKEIKQINNLAKLIRKDTKSKSKKSKKVTVNFSSSSFPVKREEWVGALTASTTFGYDYYDISMRDTSQFPWISSYAQRFQRWRLKGLRVHYKANTSQLFKGPIVVALQSDYKSAFIPTTLEDGASLQGAQEGTISKDLWWTMSKKTIEESKQKLTNSTYEWGGYGYLYVGYSAQEAGVIGSLKIIFDMEFYDPVPFNEASNVYCLKHIWQAPLATTQMYMTGYTQNRYDEKSWIDEYGNPDPLANAFTKVWDVDEVVDGIPYIQIPKGDWFIEFKGISDHDSAHLNATTATIIGSGTAHFIDKASQWMTNTFEMVQIVTLHVHAITKIGLALLVTTLDTIGAWTTFIKMWKSYNMPDPNNLQFKENNDAICLWGRHIPVYRENKTLYPRKIIWGDTTKIDKSILNAVNTVVQVDKVSGPINDKILEDYDAKLQSERMVIVTTNNTTTPNNNTNVKKFVVH